MDRQLRRSLRLSLAFVAAAPVLAVAGAALVASDDVGDGGVPSGLATAVAGVAALVVGVRGTRRARRARRALSAPGWAPVDAVMAYVPIRTTARAGAGVHVLRLQGPPGGTWSVAPLGFLADSEPPPEAQSIPGHPTGAWRLRARVAPTTGGPPLVALDRAGRLLVELAPPPWPRTRRRWDDHLPQD